MNYKDYLKTEHWRIRRLQKLRNKDFRCNVCLSVAAQVHHLSYKNLWNERRSDLISICNKCHQIYYLLFGKKPSKKNWSKDILVMREYVFGKDYLEIIRKRKLFKPKELLLISKI